MPASKNSSSENSNSARSGRADSDPQRAVAWLNQFFRKIVGPAQVDNSRPGGYYEDEKLRHQQLEAMGLEMRTDANGHSYVVKKNT